MRARNLLLFIVILSASSFASAQGLEKRPADQKIAITVAPGKTPNSNATYQQLRNIGLSGETASANNLVLKRDAGVFTFTSGVFQFLAPVNGKVTGAIFSGTGTFSMVPPLNAEKRSLSLLTRAPSIEEEFSVVVLRFSDGTYDEIKKISGISNGAPGDSSELNDIRHALRKKIRYNLDARILEDVLGSDPGGLFCAFIKGKKFNSKEIYAIDPHGALEYQPEEVVFMTWDENKYGVWSAFHYSDEYKSGKASGTQVNGVVQMRHHSLDSQFEKSGKLNGDATTTFISLVNGETVVPLNLFPTLRVESVTGQGGEPLEFVQEDKESDADFYVVLPKPLAKGDSYTIRTVYSGKDAVRNEGDGNYYPVARADWYPNGRFGEFASYDMTFRIPKGLSIAATGVKMHEATEGNQLITEWKSRGEQTVAGFNFGKFKSETKKIDGMDFEVESYANTEPPSFLKGIENQVEEMEVKGRQSAPVALGTLNMTSMMKKASAEAELSVRLYTDYFGPTPFKKVSMTQQTATNYGQSWPELVYLPMSSFMDGTTRHNLMGFDPKGYFTIVGPHEVAHQWWGHTVGWGSYRDQWMSEGFSEMSASLFIQLIKKDPQEFIKFWNDEKELLITKNRNGFRAIDVGPLTLGYRLGNEKSGFDITRRMIYPKGGYILHMLRMMMWTNANGDDAFKLMMKDFVSTYTNKPASTEDFKAMVEKHMTQQMDLDHNHKMDWFFDPYVYGTALPNYRLEHSFDNGPKGLMLNVKITQSNVDDRFGMLVPLYLELANGKIVKLGAAEITGNSTIQQSIALGSIKDKPKRAILNYYDDVLATMDK